MKKLKAGILTLALFAISIGGAAYAGEYGNYEDTILDKAGDWFATLGKSEDEKNMILMERRASRTGEKFKNDAKKVVNKANEQAKKLNEDMKNLFEK